MALAAHWGTQILNQLFKLKKKKHQTPNNNSTTAVKFSQSQRCSACIADIGSRYRNLYELLLINLNCLFKSNNICFYCLSCRCPPFWFFLFELSRLLLPPNPFKCTVYHIYEMYWYQREADDFVFKQRPQDKGQCFSPHR